MADGTGLSGPWDTPLPPRVEGTVHLADGREIGIAEFGPPDGHAVLWFHGTPGGRRQVPPAARAHAAERDVRIVGVERPGSGASTPHLHANVRGFADDVLEVADALGIDRFGVIGLSGGGPYVLAIAHDAPDRVVAGVVLGGVAPTTGPEAAPGGVVDLARRFRQPVEWARPALGFGLTTVARLLRPLEASAIDLYARMSPEGDRIAFGSPGMKAMFTDDLARTAAGIGLGAVPADMVLFGRPWGFSIRDISVPVRFWHGDADHLVPLDHAHHMASLVPEATVTVRPGESHLGTLIVGDEAVQEVLDHWEPAEAVASA